jgi:hypothetical protein
MLLRDKEELSMVSVVEKDEVIHVIGTFHCSLELLNDFIFCKFHQD